MSFNTVVSFVSNRIKTTTNEMYLTTVNVINCVLNHSMQCANYINEKMRSPRY